MVDPGDRPSRDGAIDTRNPPSVLLTTTDQPRSDSVSPTGLWKPGRRVRCGIGPSLDLGAGNRCLQGPSYRHGRRSQELPGQTSRINRECQDEGVTSIVVWCGVDSRSPASLYIATDSRISWGRNAPTWDRGRKAFSSTNAPFVFGYWGQVLFPALALPEVQERADRGMYSEMASREAHDSIATTLIRQWSKYPPAQRADVGIIIGSRNGEGMNSQFHISILTYSSAKNDWKRLRPAEWCTDRIRI